MLSVFFFFFQAEDGIRDVAVTGVQTCALPISNRPSERLISLPTGTVYVRYICVGSMISFEVGPGFKFELRVAARNTLATSPKLISLTNPTPPSALLSICRLNCWRVHPLASTSKTRNWLVRPPVAVALTPPLVKPVVLGWFRLYS